jgi:predicted nucleic acid-binding protein
MIGDGDLVVLDTNALVYIGRGKEVKDWLESEWKLLSRPRR